MWDEYGAAADDDPSSRRRSLVWLLKRLILAAVIAVVVASITAHAARASDPTVTPPHYAICPVAEATTATAGTDVYELQKLRREQAFICDATVHTDGGTQTNTNTISDQLNALLDYYNGANPSLLSVSCIAPDVVGAGTIFAPESYKACANKEDTINVHCSTDSPPAPCAGSGGGSASTVGLDPTANTVKLDATALDRMDLLWWGVWATVGMLMGLLVLPRVFGAFKFWAE